MSLSDVWYREISFAAGGTGVGETCLEGLVVTQQRLPELPARRISHEHPPWEGGRAARLAVGQTAQAER